MSTANAVSNLHSPKNVDDGEFLYRPLSTAAVVSALFGVLSMATFAGATVSLSSCVALCPIPVVGLIAGVRSLASMRATPGQLSGRKLALAGTMLSSIGLIGGLGYASYIHATEVPEGYERTSFFDFRPDEVEERSGQPVPSDVAQLEGKRVFIKGYMRPGTHVSPMGTPVRHNVSRFLLVRDSKECCFGDLSSVQFYDKVDVMLVDSLRTDFSSGIFRVGGILRIDPSNLRRSGSLPVYRIEADHIQ